MDNTVALITGSTCGIPRYPLTGAVLGINTSPQALAQCGYTG